MNNRNNDTEVKPDVIAGRNPVSEAIRSGRPIDKILGRKGRKERRCCGNFSPKPRTRAYL